MLSSALEPLTEESGALLVVPGSHREPLHSAVGELLASSPPEAVAERLPRHSIDSQPTDLIVFSCDLFHGSSGGGTRRMLSVLMDRLPSTPEEEAATRMRLRTALTFPELQGYPPGTPHYSAEWLSGGGIGGGGSDRTRRERRQRWVALLRRFCGAGRLAPARL